MTLPLGNGKRIPLEFTLSQLIIIGSIIAGVAINWGTTQSTLVANREILIRLESSQHVQEADIKTIRGHQIVNEQIIDEHTREIEEIRVLLGLDGNRGKSPKAGIVKP